MPIGEKIIKLRKEKNLSQEKLANNLGITRQTLSSWESNITIPDLNQINKIANFFNITIDNLIDNNINLIIEKVNNTEKIAKKQIKFTKILLITIYFLILFSLIIFTIFILTKRDFTNYYQTEFTCYANDKEYQVYLSTDEEGNNTIVTYIPSLQTTEEYPAGDNIYEMIESLNTLKKVVINNGGKCK